MSLLLRSLAAPAFACLISSASTTAFSMPPAPTEARLFAAIDRGDATGVANVLKQGDDVYVRDALGRTSLARAIAMGKPAVVDFLLKRRPDLDGRDLSGETALHWAAKTGDVASIAKLLKAGANPRLENRRCETPSDEAAGFDAEPAFQALVAAIGKGPDADDGSVEECPRPREEKNFRRAAIGFFRHRLTIRRTEDYNYAFESLTFLLSHPASLAKVGGAGAPIIAAFLDHDVPDDADEGESMTVSNELRAQAVAVLKKIQGDNAGNAALDRTLLKIVAKGPDRPGFRAALATIDRSPAGRARAVKALDDLKGRHVIEVQEYRRYKRSL